MADVGIEKEVYFNEYCYKCENKDTHDGDDPCDICLTNPFNTYSHKPIYFAINSIKENEQIGNI